MAICVDWRREMLEAAGCTLEALTLDEVTYRRRRWATNDAGPDRETAAGGRGRVGGGAVRRERGQRTLTGSQSSCFRAWRIRTSCIAAVPRREAR
jgi:hypothetical protein